MFHIKKTVKEATTDRPPITPPTMAPILGELELEGDVVGRSG
jgi:hypothetical protein